MIEELIQNIWFELRLLNCKEIPNFDWVVKHLFMILQQYPSGLSRPVLLTELGTRWSTSLRRGEQYGRLRQALMTQQLSADDVVYGVMTRTDQFRCRLEAEDAALDFILHRQFADWTAFCRHHISGGGFDFMNDRQCRITGCRMLSFNPPILLPTPLVVPILDVDSAGADNALFHRAVLPSYIETKALLDDSRSFGGGVSYGDSNSLHAKAAVENTALQRILDLNAVLLLVAQVVSVGDPSTHASRGATVFRVVLLRLKPTDNQDKYQSAAGATALNSAAPVRFIHLILFDDQVSLASLFRIGEWLLLFRPFFSLNAEESLYGTSVAAAAGSGSSSSRDAAVVGPMGARVVHRPAPDLEVASNSSEFATCHVLYGMITVVVSLQGLREVKEDEAAKSGRAKGGSNCVAPPDSSDGLMVPSEEAAAANEATSSLPNHDRDRDGDMWQGTSLVRLLAVTQAKADTVAGRCPAHHSEVRNAGHQGDGDEGTGDHISNSNSSRTRTSSTSTDTADGHINKRMRSHDATAAADMHLWCELLAPAPPPLPLAPAPVSGIANEEEVRVSVRPTLLRLAASVAADSNQQLLCNTSHSAGPVTVPAAPLSSSFSSSLDATTDPLPRQASSHLALSPALLQSLQPGHVLLLSGLQLESSLTMKHDVEAPKEIGCLLSQQPDSYGSEGGSSNSKSCSCNSSSNSSSNSESCSSSGTHSRVDSGGARTSSLSVLCSGGSLAGERSSGAISSRSGAAGEVCGIINLSRIAAFTGSTSLFPPSRRDLSLPCLPNRGHDPLIVVAAFVQQWAPLVSLVPSSSVGDGAAIAVADMNSGRQFDRCRNISSYTIGKLQTASVAPFLRLVPGSSNAAARSAGSYQTAAAGATRGTSPQHSNSPHPPPPSRWEETSEELCEAGSLAMLLLTDESSGDSITAYLTPRTISTTTAVSLQRPIAIEHRTFSFLLTYIDDLVPPPLSPAQSTTTRRSDRSTPSDSVSDCRGNDRIDTPRRYRIEAVSDFHRRL